jgi:peptidoglycan hydrolase-like protein with peptidoglycan-binding domain
MHFFCVEGLRLMTPRRVRGALCLFLLLAAAVAYNALVRQVRPTPSANLAVEAAPPPAPKLATSALAERAPDGKDAAGKRPQRAARGKPDLAEIAPAAAAVEPALKADAQSSETIRAIQRELRQRGYGALASDGSLRPATRAAILAYEFDNRLPLTGQASEALLRVLVFGGTLNADPALAGKVRTAEAQELVRAVQQRLTALGYQPGPVDGQLQEATMRAIREFELDKGLVPKGRVSAEVLAQLTAPQAKLSRR